MQVRTLDGRDIELTHELLDALKSRVKGPLVAPTDSGYEESRTVWNAMIDRRPARRRALPRRRRRDRLRPVRARARPSALHQGRRAQHRRPGHRRRRPHARPLAHARSLGRSAAPSRPRAGRLPARRRGPRDPGARPRRGPRLRLGHRHRRAHPGRRVRLPDEALGLDARTTWSAWTSSPPRGRLVRASASENPDLFWGLRGGGGNFGVVTGIDYTLYPVGPEIVGGRRGLAGERGARGARALPDARAERAARTHARRAHPPGAARPVAAEGDARQADRRAARLPQRDRRTRARRRWRRSSRSASPSATCWCAGRTRSCSRCSTAPSRKAGATTGRASTSPRIEPALCEQVIEHAAKDPLAALGRDPVPDRGRAEPAATTSTPPSATATRASCSTSPAPWEQAADDAANVAWAREAWSDMRSFSTGGTYINFLTEDEGPERTAAALGKGLARLAEVKARGTRATSSAPTATSSPAERREPVRPPPSKERRHGHLSVFNHVTLDGFFTDASSDMSFAHRTAPDPEWDAFVQSNAGAAACSCSAGRPTTSWPASGRRRGREDDAGRGRTDEQPAESGVLEDHAEGLVEQHDPDDERPGERGAEAQAESESDMVILGSGSVISQLTQHRLIDAYQFVVNPVCSAGEDDVRHRHRTLPLRLTTSRVFGNGNVLLELRDGEPGSPDDLPDLAWLGGAGERRRRTNICFARRSSMGSRRAPFPAIAASSCSAGPSATRVEFVTLMWFDSIESVRLFAGPTTSWRWCRRRPARCCTNSTSAPPTSRCGKAAARPLPSG